MITDREGPQAFKPVNPSQTRAGSTALCFHAAAAPVLMDVTRAIGSQPDCPTTGVLARHADRGSKAPCTSGRWRAWPRREAPQRPRPLARGGCLTRRVFERAVVCRPSIAAPVATPTPVYWSACPCVILVGTIAISFHGRLRSRPRPPSPRSSPAARALSPRASTKLDERRAQRIAWFIHTDRNPKPVRPDLPLTSRYLGANLRRRGSSKCDGGPVRGSCWQALVGHRAHSCTSNLTAALATR